MKELFEGVLMGSGAVVVAALTVALCVTMYQLLKGAA